MFHSESVISISTHQQQTISEIKRPDINNEEAEGKEMCWRKITFAFFLQVDTLYNTNTEEGTTFRRNLSWAASFFIV